MNNGLFFNRVKQISRYDGLISLNLQVFLTFQGILCYRLRGDRLGCELDYYGGFNCDFNGTVRKHFSTLKDSNKGRSPLSINIFDELRCANPFYGSTIRLGNVLDLWIVFLEAIHYDLSYPQIQNTIRVWFGYTPKLIFAKYKAAILFLSFKI